MFIKLCNGFLKSSEFEKVVRNENFGDRVVFEGRPVFVATPITLSDGEKKKKKKLAQLVVLMNTSIVDLHLE